MAGIRDNRGAARGLPMAGVEERPTHMPKPRAASRPRAPLARYSNYFEVGHNPYEFLIDFGQYQPEAEGVLLHTRIAVGPTHAKLLATTLSRAVALHEAENGPIAEASDPLDPLEVVLRSLPDFERRAVNARRGAAPAGMPASQRPLAKR
jgi:hypothetical protein